MNQNYTLILKAKKLSGHYPQSDPSGDNVKYFSLSAWYGVFMVLFIMFSVSSLSAQKLINLDDYLSKMKDEPVTTSFRPSADSEMDHAEFVKSQLYDLLSTIYLLNGKVTRHQTGRFVRMVTTADDLTSLPKLADKLNPELVSVQTLIVKVPDAGSLNSLEKINSDLLEILPMLERVFFIVQYKPADKDIRQLESKLPDISTEKVQYERVPITWLYKSSTPS